MEILEVLETIIASSDNCLSSADKTAFLTGRCSTTASTTNSVFCRSLSSRVGLIMAKILEALASSNLPLDTALPSSF